MSGSETSLRKLLQPSGGGSVSEAQNAAQVQLLSGPLGGAPVAVVSGFMVSRER